MTADKISKASAALDAAEANQADEEAKAQDAENKLENAAERTAEAGANGALSTEEKAQMQAAIEKAGAQQQANIAAARERQAVKGELLKDIKKEAEAQAEVEAADFADMSPEQIIAADNMDREQQFLTELTPNAIRAAEVELSSVFSSVIGSLLTNMLTREPELVARHMGVPTKRLSGDDRASSSSSGIHISKIFHDTFLIIPPGHPQQLHFGSQGHHFLLQPLIEFSPVLHFAHNRSISRQQ